MANKAQLLALRKKYHLGEFRKSKTSKRKVFKSASRPSYMAKKRSGRRKSTALGTAGIWGSIIGVGGYVAYELYVRPKIPLSGTALGLAEIALGMYLGRKGGALGNVGKVMTVISTYSLIKSIAPGQSSGNMITVTGDLYGGY